MNETVRRDCLICAGPMQASTKYERLLECEACGFMTADIGMTEEEAEALYGKDYFHGQEYSDYKRDKKILQKNFSHRLKTLEKFMQDTHSDLLEIGCAYGYFLDLSKNRFKTVKGVDISADAIKYATDVLHLDAKSGNYIKMEKTSFDVCCMWDTIEHLGEPDKFINKISDEISQGGLLAITTGDIGSLNAKSRGKKWRQIHPPTHLHYFSVKTLIKLLDRFGFKTVHISHPANLINVETALYTIFCLKRNKPEVYEKMIGVFRKLKLDRLNIPVNFFDFMYIIARKE